MATVKSKKKDNLEYNDYFLVNMIFAWVREIKKKKGSGVILSSIVNEAVRDVLENKVSLEDVKKSMKAEYLFND
jgi:hypothetical protein